MRARTVTTCVLLVLLTMVSCSSERRYQRAELPKIVMQPDEAPEGTEFDEDSSGFQTLEQYVENNDAKKRRFEAAGFQTSYFTQFFDPTFFHPASKNSSGIAISFAMLFESPEGAGRGLRALQTSLHEEGEDLQDRPAPGIGEESFALHGILDKDAPQKPSGVLIAWRRANAVFGVTGLGEKDTVGEPAVRQLAELVDQRAAPD